MRAKEVNFFSLKAQTQVQTKEVENMKDKSNTHLELQSHGAVFS